MSCDRETIPDDGRLQFLKCLILLCRDLLHDVFTFQQACNFHHRFLRGIAYRDFTRLIHGYLGNKRIPLPACGYDAIRKQFPTTIGVQRGFQEDKNKVIQT